MEAEFTELPNAPYGSFITPKRISNSEFVTATNESMTGENRLVKFNAMMNSWEELLDYSGWRTCSDKRDSKFSGLYNIDYQDFVLHDNTCYIIRDNYVIEIDIITNKIRLHANEIEGARSGINPVMASHNDKLHIIGGFHSKKHTIFDTQTKQFTDNHTFQELFHGISSAALIHIKSKRMLYLMGGYDQGENQNMDKVWRCFLNDDEGFSWEYLSLKLPIGDNRFPYLLTTNERYVVVLLSESDPNKWADDDDSDDGTEGKYSFYYLDLESDEMEMKFIKSPLSTGTISGSHMVMTGNYEESKLIIDGYIRRLTMCRDLMIPDEIMGVITSYYDEEIVHLFWRGEADNFENMHHWMINIAKIIPEYYTLNS